jgi:CelD/BcsL family acetyltransferase involved in cellulose biosynthesis
MKWTCAPASALAAMAGPWESLHARSERTPLLAFDFVAPLLAEFGAGGELLACCEHQGRTVAMALLVRVSRFGWSTFQPPQAPLGLWLQESGVATEALLATLLPALPGTALLLALTQCDPDLMARPPDRARVRTLDYIATARIGLGGGFDAYWEGRGKNLRANLKKQRNRLAREGVALRLQVSRDADQVAAAIDQYGRLESAGWKAGGGSAVDGANAQGRYYRAMLEAFCRRGAGSIYRYWFGEQLVAIDLCIEDGAQLIVLKTTYDESVAGGLSPALLMREEALRALFDAAHPGRLEFYGRVMEWHTRWTNEMRTLYHVNYYRWGALARLHALWQSRRAVQPKETHVP